MFKKNRRPFRGPKPPFNPGRGVERNPGGDERSPFDPHQRGPKKFNHGDRFRPGKRNDKDRRPGKFGKPETPASFNPKFGGTSGEPGTPAGRPQESRGNRKRYNPGKSKNFRQRPGRFDRADNRNNNPKFNTRYDRDRSGSSDGENRPLPPGKPDPRLPKPFEEDAGADPLSTPTPPPFKAPPLFRGNPGPEKPRTPSNGEPPPTPSRTFFGRGEKLNRTSPIVHRFRDARDGKDPKSIFVEGHRLIGDLIHIPLAVREFLFTVAAADRPEISRVIDALRGRGASGHNVTPDVMEFVSDLETPPGLVVRADRPVSPALPLADNALWVVLDGLQSPANAGAVVRVAEAAGAQAVIAAAGTADLWSPKALRGSSGSAFRVPLVLIPAMKEVSDRLKGRGITAVAADQNADMDYWDFDWTRPTAIILGAEGRGLGDLSEFNVQRVRVPMAGKVESLNVAVAAGLLLMEAARQRRSKI